MAFTKRSPWVWIPVMLLAGLFFGLVVMLLWNWLIPNIFNGPTVTYWEAIGLLILGRLLTGSLTGAHQKWNAYHNYKEVWKEKWAHMTPEEREALKEKYRHRCGSYPKKEDDGGTTG